MFTGSSHPRRYEQVATPPPPVRSFYCMRMTESDASTSGTASFSRAAPRGRYGTGASIICLCGSQATLTRVRRAAKWRMGVAGGASGRQQCGTSERTGWPATRNEDAKAPSVKLKFLNCKFSDLIVYLLKQRASLQRCWRKDQQSFVFHLYVRKPSLPALSDSWTFRLVLR